MRGSLLSILFVLAEKTRVPSLLVEVPQMTPNSSATCTPDIRAWALNAMLGGKKSSFIRN